MVSFFFLLKSKVSIFSPKTMGYSQGFSPKSRSFFVVHLYNYSEVEGASSNLCRTVLHVICFCMVSFFMFLVVGRKPLTIIVRCFD